MSCMITSPEALSTVADALARILTSGYDLCGFEAPYSLYNALEDCADHYRQYSSTRIFEALYALNVQAYGGRYKEPGLNIFPDIPEPKHLNLRRERAEWLKPNEPWRDAVKPDHYKLLKLLEFVAYQCSEDATRSKPLTLALIDMVRVIREFIISNTETYARLGWGMA